MEIVSIPIADLKMDPVNVRKHGPRNIETIVASLQKFGQQKPIVIDKDGVVVAGNGTLAAARQLGWTSIDAVRTGLEGSMATAYAIADNRTAETAEWDDKLLAETLAALQTEDEGLAMATGFDENEIDFLGELQGQITENEESSLSSLATAKHTTIKVLIDGSCVKEFEAAIAATGNLNRAEALSEICKAYLGKETGQLDV